MPGTLWGSRVISRRVPDSDGFLWPRRLGARARPDRDPLPLRPLLAGFGSRNRPSSADRNGGGSDVVPRRGCGRALRPRCQRPHKAINIAPHERPLGNTAACSVRDHRARPASDGRPAGRVCHGRFDKPVDTHHARHRRRPRGPGLYRCPSRHPADYPRLRCGSSRGGVERRIATAMPVTPPVHGDVEQPGASCDRVSSCTRVRTRSVGGLNQRSCSGAVTPP